MNSVLRSRFIAALILGAFSSAQASAVTSGQVLAYRAGEVPAVVASILGKPGSAKRLKARGWNTAPAEGSSNPQQAGTEANALSESRLASATDAALQAWRERMNGSAAVDATASASAPSPKVESEPPRALALSINFANDSAQLDAAARTGLIYSIALILRRKRDAVWPLA
jgi:hypothetical protein